MVNQYCCDISFINVHCDYHCICVWERYEINIGLGESYWHVQPFGSHDWAFDRHMIDLMVVLSFLYFVFKIQVGASGGCVDGYEGWEIGTLL
jgi:hypothetical protein